MIILRLRIIAFDLYQLSILLMTHKVQTKLNNDSSFFLIEYVNLWAEEEKRNFDR